MALSIYGFYRPRQRKVEQAGISYEFLCIKDKLALGLPTTPVLRLPETQGPYPIEGDDPEDLADLLDEDGSKYKKYISKLDPNDANEQDHYKVLGLSKIRHKATLNQIRTAYRQKVLKYHPDKGTSALKGAKNEAIFACIQKAYEQLGISEDKKRAFDSVDPTFDESTPDSIDNTKFFPILRPVFERNSRFSFIQPVPQLGNEESSREEVEAFYEFWFNWKSWREFSYLDAEDKTKGEDRWERREIEKVNKAEREKMRKADLKRISTLVELAYCNDPRVAKFKEEDKKAKEEYKEQKRRERRQREEAQRELEMKEKERVEAEERARADEEKQAQKALNQKKKILSTQKKRLRELVASTNCWTDKAKRKEEILEQVERICLCAEFDAISQLCEDLANVNAFEDAIQLLKKCAKKEDNMNGDSAKALADVTGKSENGSFVMWSPAELQLLIKATTLYPQGTAERWRLVATYLTDHAASIGGQARTEKEVIKQVKMLKTLDPNSSAVTQVKNHGQEFGKTAPTIPIKTPQVDADNWTIAQQKQLETALRSVPSTDADRWEKIAQLVEGRTKKECIQRYKKLAEIVKQAKGQQNGKSGGGEKIVTSHFE